MRNTTPSKLSQRREHITPSSLCQVHNSASFRGLFSRDMSDLDRQPGSVSLNPGEGGILLGILGRGVPPGSPNPDPISDQKIPFSTARFQTWPLTSIPVIRPLLYRN